MPLVEFDCVVFAVKVQRVERSGCGLPLGGPADRCDERLALSFYFIRIFAPGSSKKNQNVAE